jgi:hypothetical protein
LAVQERTISAKNVTFHRAAGYDFARNTEWLLSGIFQALAGFDSVDHSLLCKRSRMS